MMRGANVVVVGLLASLWMGCGGDDSTDGPKGHVDGGQQPLDAAGPRADAARDDAAQPLDDAGRVKTCAQRSASECTLDSCLVLTGRKLDLSKMCVSQAVDMVGCMERATGCTAAITLATDPSGGVWQFSSGCLPSGWQGNPLFPDGQHYVSSLPSGWSQSCP